MECELAKGIGKIANASIQRFGSSDCRCPSHLFYFAAEPLKNRLFIKLIQGYHILRFEKKVQAGDTFNLH